MFELTREETDELSRCKNFTSIQTRGVKGGRAYLSHAFTEHGIYMLMTVLRGDLAVKQSRALILAFKAMKDYIIENQQLLISQRDYIALTQQVASNTNDIRKIRDDMVTKADLAYQKIYRRAKRKLLIIDDYIRPKTLQHMLHSKTAVKLTIISDNKAKPPLRHTEYSDFRRENPGRNIDFITSANKTHDRYIILDFNTKDMKVYHCGASSKDAGKKITTITQIKDLSRYNEMVKCLLANPALILH